MPAAGLVVVAAGRKREARRADASASNAARVPACCQLSPLLSRPGMSALPKRTVALICPTCAGSNAAPVTIPTFGGIVRPVRAARPMRGRASPASGAARRSPRPRLTATTCSPAREGDHVPGATRSAQARRRARAAARSARGRASSIERGRARWSATLRSCGSVAASHGVPVGEAARRARVPLHRVAERVAAEAVERRLGPAPSRHPDLVALVDERRARQRQQQQRRGAQRSAAEPGGEAREVVVREHPGDPVEPPPPRRSPRADARRPSGAWRSSKAKARSRCSRYGARRAVGR